MEDKYYYEYEADSHYCYPGTYVLKNKLNIRDENELKSAERSITSLRTAQFMQNPIDGKLDFDYLKSIHKFIFGDIYEWAGTTRTVNISKGNQFCLCEFIEEQMISIMRRLEKENYLENLSIKKLADRLAYYIGEINAIHPFREGNGRSQRMFIECIALHNGLQLDFAKISNEEMLKASVETFNLEYEFMSEILLRALSIKE
ncbi:Fic/DOC family protein [Romboutsia lituseburensis]|uniref:Fic/DOC family protein n=1 Tax=Romboutsia lituseburensis TaxID=1537 RepID=UPI00215A68C6|nr:Fic family protein [Romboutsia lituseburensis]MCR8744263.1 Fic family protein [Romboutsia lituseburensis]